MLNLLPDEFHSNPSYVGSKKKWIFLVCQGAFILNRDYYLHDWFALDDMTAQSFKASRDFKLCIGQYKGVDCEVWNLKNVEIQLNNLMLVELREVLISCSALSFAAVCRSSQLVSWHKTNKFCGRCGKKNTISSTEHCFLCSHCNLTNYPKISPCIIVVVINEDKCLLARQPSWPKGMYSALAGFIEAGESAEEAIRREIIEEVGILVSDVHYFGSQSWPFPGQLMLGYIAYAKSNKLTINKEEISDANWFKYDQLPGGIPPSTIMSGKLIRYAVSQMVRTNES